MPLFRTDERRFARAVTRLAYCNPFLPERIEIERDALGDQFSEQDADWNIREETVELHTNVRLIYKGAMKLAEHCRDRLAQGDRAEKDELGEYEGVVLFGLYHHYIRQLDASIAEGLAQQSPTRVGWYRAFVNDLRLFTHIPGVTIEAGADAAHVLAFFFQLRRAFEHIFHYLIGGSQPAVRLRAAVWESIFTHDMRRYRRSLYARMGDLTTLVTGPSGTGKELVARAVGLSRYIPFDPTGSRFTEHFAGSFLPVNLSSLSPTLIESELFGHKRGAFTGALQNRKGYLEACPELGTVFLDEIGDIDWSVQVKLLRLLQSRTFQRLGETDTQLFRGKIIAATNRDLTGEIRAGRFREDFYYRLCSDVIVTPSLHEQLADKPDELDRLVLFITRRVSGEQEARELADEAVRWITTHLGRDYAWPGNVRELEQCVRNVMVRRSYHPTHITPRDDAEALMDQITQGSLTADQLLDRYCAIVYQRTGSYLQTAERLGLDRRTVKRRVGGQRH